MLCAYPFDVGSLSRTCHPRGVSENCVPGCTQGGNWPGAWCDPPHSEQWPCAWRPNALGRVMQLREEYRRQNVKPNMKVGVRRLSRQSKPAHPLSSTQERTRQARRVF